MTTRPVSRSLLASATAAVLTIGLMVGLTVGLTGATATAEAPLAPVDGAPGIGDPYWPLDGNGGIDVASYRIRNSYDFDSKRLAGRTRLGLTATSDLRSFSLDFLLDVSKVTVDGVAAGFTKSDGDHELRITPATPLAAGTDHVVVVRYDDHPARHSYAGETNWLANGREVVAMNEPHMAPWWFPSNDHPQDKAIVDVRIRVPKGREVISNGELKGTRVGKRSTTWHWRAS